MPNHTDYNNCGPCNKITWVRPYYSELMCDDCVKIASTIVAKTKEKLTHELVQIAVRVVLENQRSESVLQTLTTKY